MESEILGIVIYIAIALSFWPCTLIASMIADRLDVRRSLRKRYRYVCRCGHAKQ